MESDNSLELSEGWRSFFIYSLTQPPWLQPVEPDEGDSCAFVPVEIGNQGQTIPNLSWQI